MGTFMGAPSDKDYSIFEVSVGVLLVKEITIHLVGIILH